MKNELNQLFEYIKAHKGRPLSNKEKKDAMRLYKKYDKDDKNLARLKNAALPNNHSKRSAFLKYFGTAIASIILCLSVALPITIKALDKPTQTIYLPSGNDKNNPAASTLRYQSDVTSNSDYKEMKKLGFLLFLDKEFEEQVFDTETVFIEYTSKKAGLSLSYVVEDAMVLIKDESEFGTTFTMDYRIRTYNEYDFSTYYTDLYATLEKVYNDKAKSITDESNLYEFDNFEIIKSQELKENNDDKIINAFTAKDIKVFSYISPNGVASIYFNYGNNEYMITLSKDINAPRGSQVVPTAEYIQKHFIPALFKNITI